MAIPNDNLRLFLEFINGLNQVKVLAATNVDGQLAIMGAVEGGEQLRQLLEAADIDHYIVSSGDVFLGTFKATAYGKTPKAMVERLEKAVRDAENLPDFLTVCSSTLKTREGLKLIQDWLKAKKPQKEQIK